MSPATADAPYDEQATLNELVFALGRRDEPTVALVECASLAKRRELEAELAARLPEYQFYALDVTPYQVTSLLGTLTEHLPAEVRDSPPVTWLVNVHGLENSRLLSQDGQLVPSPLTAQLNLERELLFRRVPYLIVLWGDADFFRVVQREAPDFWHWVTYRFRFEDHTARPVAALPPLPPERLPGPGNVAARQARIAELQERYDHLALDDSDKKRLLKDKIDILSLLGAEYAEAFQYEEAAEIYRMAIALQRNLGLGSKSMGYLLFNLGNVYLRQHRFIEAIATYEQSKELADGRNMPVVLHQIGMAYEEQEKWDDALERYRDALNWQKQHKDYYQIGNTYHQIGFVYQMQQQWAAALNNYQKAISCYQKFDEYVRLSGTYHQIGTTYAAQNQWELALQNYQHALEWAQRVDSPFEMGGIYYEIGRVYEKIRVEDEALLWYERAVEVFTRYGHPFLPNAVAATVHMKHLLSVKQKDEAGSTSGG